jgi:hypothetical protein
MSETLCYILPVRQAFKGRAASCMWEAETTRGQRHEDIEFYNCVTQPGYLTDDEVTDELGHQLPNISYPGLDRRYGMRMVEGFHDHDDFRPKGICSIQHRPAFDAEERRRRYHEAREFLQLRTKRRPCMWTSTSRRPAMPPESVISSL